MPIEVAIPAELNGPPTDLLDSVSKLMYDAVSLLLSERSVAVPDVRVVLAADVMDAASSESERLGLDPDRRVGSERAGGIVGGKCLLSPDRRSASVIVAPLLLVAVDGNLQVQAAGILGHEFGHLLFGAARGSEVEAIEHAWKPWDVAGVIALEAAEEFRVSRFGNAMAEVILQPKDASGEDVLLADVAGPLYRAGLPVAFEAVSPKLQQTILSYRLHKLSLEQMWSSVVRTTEEVALYIAYAEANTTGTEIAIDESLPVARLLEPFWRPLLSRLRETPLLPEAGEWEQDRECFMEIGRQGFAEFWLRLGLETRPEGDAFHLSVIDPDDGPR